MSCIHLGSALTVILDLFVSLGSPLLALRFLLLKIKLFARFYASSSIIVKHLRGSGDTALSLNRSSGPAGRFVWRSQSELPDSPDTCKVVQKSKECFAHIVAEISAKRPFVDSERCSMVFWTRLCGPCTDPGNQDRVKSSLNRASFPPSCCKCPILPPRCRSASSHGGQMHQVEVQTLNMRRASCMHKVPLVALSHNLIFIRAHP